jgi:hypothetical protein
LDGQYGQAETGATQKSVSIGEPYPFLSAGYDGNGQHRKRGKERSDIFIEDESKAESQCAHKERKQYVNRYRFLEVFGHGNVPQPLHRPSDCRIIANQFQVVYLSGRVTYKSSKPQPGCCNEEDLVERDKQKLDAHYSAKGLTGRMIVLLGITVLFLGFLSLGVLRNDPNWVAILVYALTAVLVLLATNCWYWLRTQMGQVIVSTDAAGFLDIRIAPTAIPWSAIDSLSPYVVFGPYKATGLALVIDPDFKRGLAIPLAVRFNSWNSLLFGRSLYVDTRCLDVDCFELSRAAEPYLSKGPKP